MQQTTRKSGGIPPGPMEPITSPDAIAKIKKLLANRPRDLALFTFGTNTAFRASDIVGLNVGDVRFKQPGDVLMIREQKTRNCRKAARQVVINNAVFNALQTLLATMPAALDTDPLFVGEKRGTRMTRTTLGRFVKAWCSEVGLHGDFASHTLRKTWAYQQRKAGASVDLLQDAFGHSSGKVTLQYAGIMSDEKRAMYMNEI
jgi:integrase